jgi:predicted dehydrogenase
MKIRPKNPNILLIGAGSFGKHHLETLLKLQREGILNLTGVVVQSQRSKKLLQKEYSVPIYTTLSEDILAAVDAVDIVTPVETHFDLISRCLSSKHVFVEKPLVATLDEARALKRKVTPSDKVLMVGHIFRFHPVVTRLKSLVAKMKEKPSSIRGVFTNPVSTDKGKDIEIEMLHLSDIVDYLFEKKVVRKYAEDKGRLRTVSLIYAGGMHALFKLGWVGDEKRRTLTLTYRQQQVICDLQTQTIRIYKNGLLIEAIDCADTITPLEAELRTFVDAISSPKVQYPDIEVGTRIISTALMTGQAALSPGRKKVAIIGAGIFGSNCAIELASSCDVTLFEKNKDILSEASYINQYRHHLGYHYPRSQETVDDIMSDIGDFEHRYKPAIITEFPTYYSVAKRGSKVTADEFVKFCDRNKLPYVIEHPAEEYFNVKKASVTLKTYEPIYSYHKLKKITEDLLEKKKVKTRLSSEITHVRILPNGQKELTIKKGGKVTKERFDYVVNVTYTRYNNFCDWLGFPKRPIRLDLVEVLWMKIDMPKISLAVMDGQFTNIVPTDTDGIFTLVHIKESILQRFVPKDGLVPKNIFASSKKSSNVDKILKRSIEWFPFVKDGEILKVHYVLRGVNAYREHDDARISDIAEQGFGCFSILGGKIINSVSIAKELATMIGK